MTEKEKCSLKIRLGKRLSHDKSRIMEIIKEEIDKTETTMEQPHGEWVKKVINGMPCIVCSNCLSPRHPEVGYDWYNIYCGHCGSDNRKRGEENGTDS